MLWNTNITFTIWTISSRVYWSATWCQLGATCENNSQVFGEFWFDTRREIGANTAVVVQNQTRDREEVEYERALNSTSSCALALHYISNWIYDKRSWRKIKLHISGQFRSVVISAARLYSWHLILLTFCKKLASLQRAVWHQGNNVCKCWCTLSFPFKSCQ